MIFAVTSFFFLNFFLILKNFFYLASILFPFLYSYLQYFFFSFFKNFFSFIKALIRFQLFTSFILHGNRGNYFNPECIFFLLYFSFDQRHFFFFLRKYSGMFFVFLNFLIFYIRTAFSFTTRNDFSSLSHL